MTLGIYEHEENGYYVTMECEENLYKVMVCPCYGDNMCGYPIREMYYNMNEKNKAIATFRRYVNKYCKNS